ncbi:MAG: leucine-rich repeat domain-containing protein [Deltaproteobacteria bacterium]|nr:leucine-rich repeat domain-containing protein [Deltaproteobacteria bacterium]
MIDGKLIEIIQMAATHEVIDLDLSNKRIKRLPSNIVELTSLQALNLAENQITSLPPEIGSLTGLRDLNLAANQLSLLPPEIGKLTSLKVLNVFENSLIALSPEIGKLTRLLELNIASNQLSFLPAEIGKLTRLQRLNLWGNEISLLPPEIGSLTFLQDLDISHNKLSSLPSEIGNLIRLQKLILPTNQLRSLPPEIGHLISLKVLYLGENHLTSLPLEIANLINLKRLDLSHNHISELFAAISELRNLSYLDLTNNRLPIPPDTLLKTDVPDKIIDYYFTQVPAAAPKKCLNEAKLIIVGQAAVGKTSLVKRLVEDKFDPQEKKTDGLAVKNWSIQVNGTEIKLNVWDFGGQEIYHATHQFFLTTRSLYLLVLDSRLDEQENRLEYWLKIIRSFGGDSPVIVICNKCDQHQMDLDWRGLKDKYPDVKAFVRRASCSTGEGIDELRSLLNQTIIQLPHVSDPLGVAEFKVKQRLERMTENYITLERYKEICEDEGLADEHRQRMLIGLLHSLGTVLYFGDHPILQDTNVLNPHWVTRGVYSILANNKLFQDKGVLEIDHLARILGETEYPREKHIVLIEMMLKFELCFYFDDHRRVLIPELLQRERPFLGEWSAALTFIYDYDVLPNSVISRFIVRTHSHIKDTTYWRYGVVLGYEDDKTTALVQADSEEKRVTIKVKGAAPSRRLFLEIIRSQFREIHHSFSRLIVKEKIVIKPGVEMDYTDLIRLYNKGLTTYYLPSADEDINPKEMLDGIAPPERIEKAAIKGPLHTYWKEEEAPMPLDSLALLHLSDLHIESGTDVVTLYLTLLADLKDSRNGLGRTSLDYIIITGDMVNYSRVDEYQKAVAFTALMQEEFKLPYERLLIVPGNHDLNWDEEVYEYKAKRKVDVSRLKGSSYVDQGEGYLVRNDERYPLKFKRFAEVFYHPLLSRPYPLEFVQQGEARLFKNYGIQFLLLNSAWEIDEHFPDRSSIHPGALARALHQADEDKARSGNPTPPLRIAAWHHPVTGNDKIKDTAFLDQLQNAGVKIVLHGHVHEERNELIGYLDPVRSIHSVGAGSFGTPVRELPAATPRLYNLLQIAPDHSRVRVHTRCLRKDGGGWEGWPFYPVKGSPHLKKSYYDIDLSR